MGTEAIKSAAITSSDASPPVRTTSGKGGAFEPVVVDSQVTITTTKDTGSTYQLARIPANAIVKKVEVWLDAAGTTITGDLGIYYSSCAADCIGVSKGLEGTVINADHFASAVALAAVVTPTDETFEAGTYLGADCLLEVWKASGGLTADPGGKIDVVFTLTATSGSTSKLNSRVTYAMPFTG